MGAESRSSSFAIRPSHGGEVSQQILVPHRHDSVGTTEKDSARFHESAASLSGGRVRLCSLRRDLSPAAEAHGAERHSTTPASFRRVQSETWEAAGAGAPSPTGDGVGSLISVACTARPDAASGVKAAATLRRCTGGGKRELQTTGSNGD